MEAIRDLKPELDDVEAVHATSSTIAQFIDFQCLGDKDASQEKSSLLAKVSATEAYIAPLLEAMAMEGSYHMSTPCHYCDDEDESCLIECTVGSPWAAKIQEQILIENGLFEVGAGATSIEDEFRESWWYNPFADPPFYHPHIVRFEQGLKLGTVSEAVYEKHDFFLFDGGLFSNTAVELRSKFNSVEAIRHALGEDEGQSDVSSVTDQDHLCSKMNELTIKWALENAPDIVKHRYFDYGIKLKAGQDIEHHSGPSWIWSHLHFGKAGECSKGGCSVMDNDVK